jgi:hypothetical protein
MTATKTPLTPDQAETIAEMVRLQEESGKNDAAFARDHLSYSATYLTRIKSGELWGMIADHDRVISQLKTDIHEIQRQKAFAARRGDRKFYKLDDFEAIYIAISECRLKGLDDPDRCVVYLAPTGGGKTTLCNELSRRSRAIVVEARQAWRGSYWGCCQDIADTIRMSTHGLSGTQALEKGIVGRLSGQRRILAIDEGEFFGPAAINLIKLILNQTPTVVVLCAIPEAYDRWTRRAWHEASQLQRRTHAVVRLESIREKEAKLWLKECELNGCLDDAAKLAMNAANEFGAYDLLSRLAIELRREKTTNLVDVRKVIKNVLRFYGVA